MQIETRIKNLDKEVFFILSTARCRSSWFANFFTYKDSFCYNEESRYIKNWDELVDRIESRPEKYVGFEDPELLHHIETLYRLFPKAKYLLLERNRGESERSFMKMFKVDEEYTRRKFTRWYMDIQKFKCIIPEYKTIDFEVMESDGALKGVWKYILPDVPFDIDRFHLLTELPISHTLTKRWHIANSLGPFADLDKMDKIGMDNYVFNCYEKEVINTEFDEIVKQLQLKFSIYNVSQLQGINSKVFKDHIDKNLGTIDHLIEGFSNDELDKQRDVSVKFYWGHNHDFGDFKVNGRMGDRHINIMAHFLELFDIDIQYFHQKKVLDIGCWTGGTTLLLASLGSKVDAIEEVKKYADMTGFLIKSFGLDNDLSVKSNSLYELNDEQYESQYDMIYFPGVLYHLSDPVLALRILYNCLNDNGILLLETYGVDTPDPTCVYEGPNIFSSHVPGQDNVKPNKNDLNRAGWNYFVPSCSALQRMIGDAGFVSIETKLIGNRIYSFAKKEGFKGICKAGLSIPNIK